MPRRVPVHFGILGGEGFSPRSTSNYFTTLPLPRDIFVAFCNTAGLSTANTFLGQKEPKSAKTSVGLDEPGISFLQLKSSVACPRGDGNSLPQREPERWGQGSPGPSWASHGERASKRRRPKRIGQEYGKNMARTWQEYGKEYGKDLGRILGRCKGQVWGSEPLLRLQGPQPIEPRRSQKHVLRLMIRFVILLKTALTRIVPWRPGPETADNAENRDADLAELNSASKVAALASTFASLCTMYRVPRFVGSTWLWRGGRARHASTSGAALATRAAPCTFTSVRSVF